VSRPHWLGVRADSIANGFRSTNLASASSRLEMTRRVLVVKILLQRLIAQYTDSADFHPGMMSLTGVFNTFCNTPP